MKHAQDPASGHPRGRRIAGRAQLDHIDDPYKATHKPAKGTACPDCGAVFDAGRWSWKEGTAPPGSAPCPACQRLADNYPAGIVEIAGAFLAGREDELCNLARHCEAAEKPEHPMNRIMAISTQPGRIEITTTDIHLPRRIGEALKRAYDGVLDMHFDEDGYFVRVEWRRED